MAKVLGRWSRNIEQAPSRTAEERSSICATIACFVISHKGDASTLATKECFVASQNIDFRTQAEGAEDRIHDNVDCR